jgi:hypothetical protein
MGWMPKVEEKKFFCHKCKNELVFEVKMQRRDTCTHCGADLHCCKNCEHWDPGAHNQCKEHVTEYIPDRDAANYCTFFTFRNGQPADDDAQLKAKAKLSALFGNKPK